MTDELTVLDRRAISNAQIERVEAIGLTLEQIQAPLINHFAPGLYVREMHAPAGAWVIGHMHKTEHLNVMMKGRALVMSDGVVKEMVAPMIVKSGPGVRKVALVLEDMIWATLHPTEETDLAVLEEQLIEKSETYVRHMEDVKRLLSEGRS